MEIDIREMLKDAISRVDPRSEVVLYGSRARGEAQSGSDWDILVLVEGQLDSQREETIRSALYEVELNTGEVITAIVHPRMEWESRLRENLPFSRNVARDGIKL